MLKLSLGGKNQTPFRTFTSVTESLGSLELLLVKTTVTHGANRESSIMIHESVWDDDDRASVVCGAGEARRVAIICHQDRARLRAPVAEELLPWDIL